MADNEILIVDERTLKDKIYIIRGRQVMFDADLAQIYGYTTKSFNQQVRRNIDRFPDDFMFRLTKEEFSGFLRSQNVTLEMGAYSKYPPNAFTEQGIYMLMTVLKGSTAIEQSKALIRLFKNMKDYIIENQSFMITYKDYFALAERSERNSKNIDDIKSNMVTRAELSDFMKLFDQDLRNEELLILDGEPFRADAAYQKIYRSAKRSIIVVDDYIGVKTLQHLVHAKSGVKLTIISDNRNRILKLSEYNDFLTEYPTKKVDFIQSQKRAHDRYIVIDNDTAEMKVYHCGASSKDAGKRITSILRVVDVNRYKETINSLLTNPPLQLK